MRIRSAVGALGPVLAGVALAAPGGPGDLTFRSVAGAPRAKTFETSVTVELDDLAVTLDGEPADPSVVRLTGEPRAAFRYALRATDDVRAVGEGRPLDLVRTYESVASTVERGDGEEVEAELPELEDRAVRFRWDESAGAYRRTEPGSDETDEAFDVLAADLDFLAFLPAAPVAEGERWSVEGEVLAGLLLPGLEARVAFERELTVLPDVRGAVTGGLGDLLEGASGTCTHGGFTEADGRRMGRIEVEVELDGELELDPAVVGGSEDVRTESLALALVVRIEGEVLWDLERGCFHALSADVDGDAVVETRIVAAAGGRELVIEATAELDVGGWSRAR